MSETFDEDFDQAPEGSILTPIFLGCGAMGLGCLFSLVLIVGALALFVPGAFEFISQFSDDDADEVVAIVESHPAMIAALGEPMEFDDVEEDTDVDYSEGESGEDNILIVFHTMEARGPAGSAVIDYERQVDIGTAENFGITSVVATLESGEVIRLYPDGIDTPPPPRDLAAPEDEALPLPDSSVVETDETGDNGDETGDADEDNAPSKPQPTETP